MSSDNVTTADARRWRRNLQLEVDDGHVYHAMASRARDDRLTQLYRHLAADEVRHASLWRERLAAAGIYGEVAPSWRAHVLAFVASRFGAARVAPVLASRERRGRTMYDDQPEAAGTSLAADERSHAHLLTTISAGADHTSHADIEPRRRGVGGNALRAAVLGANDGLVSNFCLVMGVAGASAGGDPVLVAGLAGLLAGSLSMALGEWLSVQSARELFANQIAAEAEELAEFPADEEDELRRIYEAKGIDAADALRLARHIVRGDRAVALDVMAREELGIDPDELGGSAWIAAFTSFGLFAFGAIVPVVPFLLGVGPGAILASALLSGAALFALGAAITVMTGKHALVSGLRQLGFGMAAAAITFGIGRLLGAAVS